MFAVALALALLIGLSLGLLGGGGSILAVPILKYVAGMETKQAIAASLFVVAVTSAVGAVQHARAGRIQWRTGAVFGAASMTGAYLGGRLAGHVPSAVLLWSFAGMMIATAIAMLRGRRAPAMAPRGPLAVPPVLAMGAVVGLVAGFVGAGGGFLIVPALVLFGRLTMPVAVGTSLAVITIQSTGGLVGHLAHEDLDWPRTLAITAVAIAGSVVGSFFAARVPPETLRRGFGAFVLVMAAVIVLAQLGVL